MADQAPEGDDRIYVNGHGYAVDDLSFREQREMRALIKELAPDGEPADMDILPAIICVIMRREDPTYSIEQALEFKPGDLTEPRPTKTRVSKP